MKASLLRHDDDHFGSKHMFQIKNSCTTQNNTGTTDGGQQHLKEPHKVMVKKKGSNGNV